MLGGAMWYTPGSAALRRERAKLSADARAPDSVQQRHVFVPFVVEECGRLGQRALDLLRTLSHRAAESSSDADPQAASHFRTQWQQQISTCIHSRIAWLISDSLHASRFRDSARARAAESS